MRYYIHLLPTGKWYLSYAKEGALHFVVASSYRQAVSVVNNL